MGPTDSVCTKCLDQMKKHFKYLGQFRDNTESGTCAIDYDWRQVQVCNGDVTLSCTGFLIDVTYSRPGVTSERRQFFPATYGRTDAHTCVYGAAPLLTDVPTSSVCSQEGNIQAFIRDRCDGKTACTITRADLDNEIGNSACPLYAKYFKASYRCAA